MTEPTATHLTLYFHPLSSFSQKVLIALYEHGTAFKPHLLDFQDEAGWAAFKEVWPIGKFPVLRDDKRDRTVPETSIIIEYLDVHYPGKARLLPEDDIANRETRLLDRLCDLYINVPMQKIVMDRLRPEGKHDPQGVEEAKTLLATALGMVDQRMNGRTWAMGDDFTMADCAAAPALFYADRIMPLAERHKHAAAYLDRLKQRPSYARALDEAQPYFKLFPQADAQGPQ